SISTKNAGMKSRRKWKDGTSSRKGAVLSLPDLRQLKVRNRGKPRRKSGLPDLRQLKVRNRGKPRLRWEG
ncbi:MAG: hypothetical protein ABJA75_11245, partial [Bradyrhizobium sp.]